MRCSCVLLASVAHFNNKIWKNKPGVSLVLLTHTGPHCPEVTMIRGQMKVTCQIPSNE